jgi:hypothetical protein
MGRLSLGVVVLTERFHNAVLKPVVDLFQLYNVENRQRIVAVLPRNLISNTEKNY